MKMIKICLLAGLTCVTGPGMAAQNISSDVSSILRSSLAAQSGAVTIQDVALTGTVERIVGGDDQTVPIQLKATASGSARFDVSLPAGTLTESRQSSSFAPAGVWSRGDGQSHKTAGHNLLTDGAWFFPLFVIHRLLSDPSASVTFVGLERSYAHFEATESAPPNGPAGSSAQFAHWSQIEIYLDSSTLLPARLSFNAHPDKNALVDIPVVIEFSNYQMVNGTTVPMHVKRSVNGTLQLDIQVQNASFNTGLTSSSFQF